MFLNVVSLLVGFLCLFVVLIMLFNEKPNKKTNGYLIVMLIVVGVQRFFYAIEILDITANTYSPLKIKPLLALYIIPVYYLFFNRLIYGNGLLKKELLHFIFPTVLILINMVFVDYRINRLLFLGYSILYFVLISVKVKQFIFRKSPSMLDKINYRAKKSWLLIMISLVFILFIYANWFSFKDLYSQMNLGNFYRYSSLLWFGVLLYMFKNPVIIFGENVLFKNIQLSEPHDFQVWNHKPLKQIEEKDKIVHLALINKIDFIVLEIKALQQLVPLISKTTLNTDTLAKELKMPKRHLNVIFKYYCNYSINDFSNLIKVNYALALINEGFLRKYTVSSLGEKCLFNSRFTFSKNFKKFVGISVSDFVNTHVPVKDDSQWLSFNGLPAFK